MGSYDDIGIPIGGQKASASQFGEKVRDAIIDLDRRVSSYDTSNAVGKAFSTSSLVLSSVTEVAALTITGQLFKAGLAYEATMRCGVFGSAARNLMPARVRKFNATPASGADWGEYFRFAAEGTVAGLTVSAIASIFLINNTAADITSDVNLTVAAQVGTASYITVFANATSPRYFTIRPVGFAADYAGMGVQVS